jgi:hypothetical protein
MFMPQSVKLMRKFVPAKRGMRKGLLCASFVLLSRVLPGIAGSRQSSGGCVRGFFDMNAL